LIGVNNLPCHVRGEEEEVITTALIGEIGGMRVRGCAAASRSAG
jgi:hypothetical protein